MVGHDKMNKIITIRTITPLHMGTGQAVGTTDLPVSREKVTLWPNMPGSSVKGVIKEACRVRWIESSQTPESPAVRSKSLGQSADRELAKYFGSPDSANASSGAVSISDLRLLLFPVRALQGVFAYVTCPLAITRLNQFLEIVGEEAIESPTVSAGKALVTSNSANGKKLRLEDIALETVESLSEELIGKISRYSQVPAKELQSRLIVVNDDVFEYFVRNCTEVVTHVSLEFETRTAKSGFLRTEERVPAESVFVGVFVVDALSGLSAEDGTVKSIDGLFAQFGGKASVGNGLCKVTLS
jgi:CRISPR-associated protein Cmr4